MGKEALNGGFESFLRNIGHAQDMLDAFLGFGFAGLGVMGNMGKCTSLGLR